jgi:hypothetical protein
MFALWVYGRERRILQQAIALCYSQELECAKPEGNQRKCNETEQNLNNNKKMYTRRSRGSCRSNQKIKLMQGEKSNLRGENGLVECVDSQVMTKVGNRLFSDKFYWIVNIFWLTRKLNNFVRCYNSLVNDQLDALFYIIIYYTSLHVSNITVLIIRRSNCINTSSGMISLYEWLLGMPIRKELLTVIPSSHSHILIIPDDVLIQFDLLMISTLMLETCREV